MMADHFTVSSVSLRCEYSTCDRSGYSRWSVRPAGQGEEGGLVSGLVSLLSTSSHQNQSEPVRFSSKYDKDGLATGWLQISAADF